MVRETRVRAQRMLTPVSGLGIIIRMDLGAMRELWWLIEVRPIIALCL